MLRQAHWVTHSKTSTGQTIGHAKRPVSDISSPYKASLDLMCRLNNEYKRWLLDHLQLAGLRICDLGCGKLGDFLKMVHSMVRLYVGLDLNAAFVQEGQRRLELARDKSSKAAKEHVTHGSNGSPNDSKSYTLPSLDRWPDFYLGSPVDFTKPQEVRHALQSMGQASQVDGSSSTFLHDIQDGFDLVTAFYSLHSAFRDVDTLARFAETVDQLLTAHLILLKKVMSIPPSQRTRGALHVRLWTVSRLCAGCVTRKRFDSLHPIALF